MSGRWFRFYADAMRNPKVLKLSDKEFRLWVRLLAIAAENDGKIPAAEDLKLVLNTRLDHLLTGVKALLKAGLIDALTDGYEPHNWSKFQYKSDTSSDRVRKFREKRNVSETPPDTETDTELPLSKDNGAGAHENSDKEFWASAKDYLSKHGVKRPGPMIGAWVRDYGKEATAGAVTMAQVERAVEPIPFIQKVLRRKVVEVADGPDWGLC